MVLEKMAGGGDMGCLRLMSFKIPSSFADNFSTRFRR